jgi:hypothetical protein
MSLLTKRTVIGLEQETTELSAATVAATDFILAEDVQIKPVVNKHKRPAQRATLDTMSHVTGGRYSELTFRTEVKASGAAGTAYAPLGVAFQACSMIETISAGVSVTYAPASAPASANYQGPGKTASIEVYMDGLKHQMLGCRGNCKIVLIAGQVCYYEFTFQGTYVAPTDAALPTTTFLAVNPPSLVSGAFTLAGLATVVAEKLEIDFGNQLSMRPSISGATGYASAIITNREPVGSTDPEALLVATHDFYGKLISGVEASTSIVVTGGAGNITTITCPKTQYQELTPGDRNGVRTFDMGLQFNMTSGDDWIGIVQT